MTKKRSVTGVVLLATLALTCVGFAEGPQRAELTSGSTSTGPDGTEKTIKVDVDVVLVNATVTTPDGRFVANLETENFVLWEDKIKQEITYFSSEDVPVSMGVIFDVSGSMKDKIAGAHDAATTFLKGSNIHDEYFLVEFSDRPRVTQGFTNDITKLQNHIMFTPPKGLTALYDAVYLGLNTLKQGTNPKKALLLITDGEDNKSRYSFSNVREFIKEQDVQIFAIGIVSDWNSQLSIGGAGRAAIEDLTDLTGGKSFFPETIRQLQRDCDKIATELKSQYLLGYKSTNAAKDGKWRKIKVEVEPPRDKNIPKLGVRFRTGYYGPASDFSDAETR